ncbi:carbohydrate ABC transporter permease [Breznakiella homolactica]|uniref:Carbohydrate ABC transporter permease n=1 Tax=Breznakiella homolactica TaxID=2798577 RepID=A0A7T7XKR0_9SPIR|nr:carbohydrate ABC transporter permease [Breznakiella homolactica]QQO08095.1 carbohydrate ABC transporter permease [Breznakiella homolactica]
MRRHTIPQKIYFFLGSLVISVFSLMPILWIISTSFKKSEDIYAFPPQWIPRSPTLEHYISVLNNSSMMRYFLNTVIISTASTVLALIIAVLAAYGFSRFRFKGKKLILGAILFSRVLPRVALIIPFFIILRRLNLLNTYPGIVMVYLIIGMPITIWLTKGFFDNIPIEIEESAVLDGCGPLTILFKLIVPIAAPAIGAVGMYAFILSWNEFLLALALTTDISTQPISIGLAYYKLEFGISWGNLMAGSVLMSIPAVIVFTLFQKQFVSGMMSGSVKG